MTRGNPSKLFISLDITIYDEAGRVIGTLGDMLPSPETEWQPPDGTEAIASDAARGDMMPRGGEARTQFILSLMRPAYPIKRTRKRRPLLVSDLIRTGQLAGEIAHCERVACGKAFARKGTGRPQKYCSDTCRSLARNSAA